MQADIIAIGDELLIGQTVNTNSAWLGQELGKIGIRVYRSTAIGDDRAEILRMLDEAGSRSQVVIITGGLGPTKDDITKHTLCEYFESGLVTNDEALARITDYFASRGLPMLDINKQQADLPEKCKVVQNHRGTACGMWFEKNGTIFVSMPGVPYEMQGMMEEVVLPEIAAYFSRPKIIHRTVLTIGVGESFLAKKIEDWDNSLAEKNIKLAYLPSPGMVKLRMSSYGGDDQVQSDFINRKEKELMQLIGEHVYGYDQDTLQSVIGQMLRKQQARLAVAESCTGGFLSHLLTAEPGSSDFFAGGVVSYSVDLKIRLLGVNADLIERHGVVSEEVAGAMAAGAREKLQTTYGLATTGIAGPAGGTESQPVGTICLAVAGPRGITTVKKVFTKRRQMNIELASNAVLDMLRKEILKENDG